MSPVARPRPEVAVIVPTRDRARSLQRTLRSIFAQQVPNEVVVVDDGSADATPTVLEQLRRADLRVIRHEASRGVAAARNAGLAEVQAPLVAFCDDDDLWAPQKLTRQLEALQAAPGSGWCTVGAVWVGPQCEVLRGDLPPDSGDVARSLLRENSVPGGASGVVARTEEVRRLGGFDPALSSLADWDLWIRLALASPVVSVSEPLVAYQIHATNMSFDARRADRELGALEVKHQAALAALGVQIDRARQRRYRAALQLRAGKRLTPAAHAVVDAVQRRRPALLKRAVATLVAPRQVQRRADERKVAQLPPGWSAALAGWLPQTCGP